MDYYFWFQLFLKKGLIGLALFTVEAYYFDVGENGSQDRFIQSLESNQEVIVEQAVQSNLRELKLLALDYYNPEVVTIGNSRVNNFRKNMFKPYSFYNLSRITTKFNEIKLELSRLDSSSNLRVVFVIIEPFRFRMTEQDKVKTDKYSDPRRTTKKTLEIVNKKNRYLFKNSNIFKPELYPNNIGIKAVTKDRGFRSLDGSVKLGRQSHLELSKQKKRMQNYNARYPNLDKKEIFRHYNCDLNPNMIRSYIELVDFAKSKNITIVGFTPPYSQHVQDIMNADTTKYRLWHQFNSEAFQSKLKSISGYYYNFVDFGKINSNTYEMIDLIHPSEKICAKMLLSMLEDGALAKLFPKIDKNYLIERINSTELPLFNIFSDN